MIHRSFFLDKDMASLSKKGYVWTKREKTENVITAGQSRKIWNENQKKSMRIVPEEEQIAEKTSGDDLILEFPEDPSSITEEKNRLFDALLSLGDILTDYPHLRSILRKAVSREDAETLDLLHYIELTGQMPRPVKGSGLAKGSCPIQFQRLTACPCGPNVSLPHYAFACIPRYRGLRLHRRAIDRARLFILPAEADKLPVS